MSRYRLAPSLEQELLFREHCAHARFVWNLAVEQQSWWRPGRCSAPGHLERCRQLTAARAENPWLATGSQMVQQQALRDFDQALRNFYRGTHLRPTWRKAGRDEGFRVVAVGSRHVRRLNRRTAEVLVPKVGWVRFRWTRPVPCEAKSYRVTLDRAGRWHIAFATTPRSISGPGNGEVVGVDRGVVVSASLSTGEMLAAPRPSTAQRKRVTRLQRKLARAKRGSNRRAHTKLAVARLKAREGDARKDWAEKVSTDLARRFDLIRMEDLPTRALTRSARGTAEHPGRNIRQKAALNQGILASGWGLLTRRLEDKAPGRIEMVNPAFTSQRCSACGYIAPENRKSQAIFACITCGYTLNADVNAAKNIAAGYAVTARGGCSPERPVNREPQHDGLQVA